MTEKKTPWFWKLTSQHVFRFQADDALMSGFAMMYFQDPSLLGFQDRMQDKGQCWNLETLFPGLYLIVADGSKYFGSDKIHCPACTWKLLFAAAVPGGRLKMNVSIL